jgi:hypothetical protein
MKKYAPVFFVLIFFCIPNKSYGDEFTDGTSILSVSVSTFFLTEWQDDVFPLMLGLDIRTLFFGNYSNFFIEPETRIEFTPYPWEGPMLIRMQTGINLGRYIPIFFLFGFDFYGGLSGILMHDFTNTKTVIGISPQIGVTLSVGFLYFSRIQFQYEWYTDQRYNRFVFTGLYGLRLGDL